jgi:hypothetical protein
VSEASPALQAGLRIAAELERRGIPHALGGALCLGAYGIPRATIDVDINVFVEAHELGPVLDALQAVGVGIDEAAARRRAEDDGMFEGYIGPMRIDVFVPSIEFSQEAARTRRQFAPEGQPTWFLSCEALCVFKMLFFRGKDLVDLERLIAVQGTTLDALYVRRWLCEMVGDEDERMRTWDELVRRHQGGRAP